MNFANMQMWDYDPANKCFFNDNGWFEEYGLDSIVYNVPDYLIDTGVIAEESKEEYVQIFDEIHKGIEKPSCQIWVYSKILGVKKCLRITYDVEKNTDGTAKIAHGKAMDITEIKNAEESYEHRISSVFQMNPDAVSTFTGNITRNWCGNGKSLYDNIEKLQNQGTIDGFIEDAMKYIRDIKEQKEFAQTFSREHLTKEFDRGITHIHLDHHYLLDDNRDEWVRSSIEMMKNPVSGDLEFIFYTINMHRRKVTEATFQSVAEREYHVIAAIYSKTDEYVIMDNRNKFILEKKENYVAHQTLRMQKVLCDDDEKEETLKALEWDHIMKQIDETNDCVIRFNTTDENGGFHRKKLRYSCIDQERKIILMTCRDITDLYHAEKEQEKNLKNALDHAKKANQAKLEDNQINQQMTANALEEETISMDAGMNAHLSKLVNPDILYTILVSSIGNK